MKVLDLHCEHDHAFEGWFASEGDFQDQLARGLLECPMCGSRSVRKVLSAPRLNLRSAAAEPPTRQAATAGTDSADAVASTAPSPSPSPSRTIAPRELQAAWLRAARQLMANTEDVGPRFAEEARRIHHGEAEERPIRGQASVQDTVQLLEEGIAVMPLPVPAAAKETLQ